MKEDYRTIRGYELQSRPEEVLTSSMEDYLEMICRLSREHPHVRVADIAQRLQVKPSSVTKMNGRLEKGGYITGSGERGIVLTEKGAAKAGYLLHRHEVIHKFLLFLGNEDTLRETELLEHTVSPFTLGRISELLDFFRDNPAVYEAYQQRSNPSAP